jgi:uroporphyrinogen III methyltransferase/synthase
VIVVGDVVRLRPALTWYEDLPLFGRRVLVTRSEEQAAPLVLALAALGAQARVVPMIRLEPPDDARALDAALEDLEGYDVLLLTSANAVRFLAERARALDITLTVRDLEVVCVGPRTAEAALREGLPVHRVPASRFDAEGVLAEVQAELAPRGRRFLLPRSDVARDTLPEGLREWGASVDAVTVYRNVPAEVDAAALRAEIVSGELDALTFTSPSTVRRFVDLLDAPARAMAARCTVAAIGPITAAAARSAGLAPDVTPERATASGAATGGERADPLQGGRSQPGHGPGARRRPQRVDRKGLDFSRRAVRHARGLTATGHGLRDPHPRGRRGRWLRSSVLA